MPNSEISEESFSTLLKRIERQYGGSSGGGGGRRNAPIPATRQRWIQRPPDEAAYALGKGLAHSFLDLLERARYSNLSNEISQELFALLASRDGNPAVSQGFFDHLLRPPEEKDSGIGVVDLDAFFPACILFTEGNEVLRQSSCSDDDEDDDFDASFDPLTCMIRSYADYIRLKCQRESKDRDAMLEEKPLSSSSSESIAKTYSKLQTQAGRLAMLRDFTDRAFSGPRRNPSCFQNVYRCMLTPLLTCCLLSPQTAGSNGGDSSTMEAMFCMEGIWRQTYVLVEDALTVHDEGFMLLYSLAGVIEWLTEMLNLYLLSIPVQKRRFRISSKELAHRWLSMVLDVGVLLAESLEGDGHEEQRQKLMDWFESILSTSLLRWFAAVPSYRIQMGSFLVSVQRLMEIYGSRRALSLESTLKLATIAICQPEKRDTRELLGLLAAAVEQAQQLHPIGFSILQGLASIFSSDPICAATTKTLQRALTGAKDKKYGVATSKSSSEILVNLIQLFEDGKSIDTIMSYFLSHQDDMFDAKNTFSPIQQAGCLTLFGIGLLNEDANHCRIAYMFLKKLLLVYPHLGITVLPVVVDSINTAAVRGDGDSMMEQIEFLAEVVVRDPQCAREIWNLLGKEFMRESVPAVIRSSIIRLFPKVCQGNKKLYKRVIESMGDTLVDTRNNDKNENDALEIRLAIAASTADLARDGFIRDPTDVISWIQDFITDTGWVRPVSTIHQQQNEHGKAAMVHYSILALHHLVIAQELDFKLVLVVLGKKLCDVHNLEEVSKLPLIVLESLILLLGDGESEEDDSSDEDDDRLKAIGVSPQTSRSVDTLIGLWNHDCLRVERCSESIAKVTLFRCKRNILDSLNKYSFEALGVDEEGIQTVVAAALHEIDDKSRNMMQTGVRYNALKHVMGDGIEFLSTIHRRRGILLDRYQENFNEEILEFSASLSGFISKIIKLEEDTLGSSLWQKRQHANAREKKQKGKGKGSSRRAKLSEVLPSPKSVLNIYEDNRCQSSALGALLSFEGKPSSILFDLAMDATSDPSDAIFQTFFVQSWLNAARSILLHLASTRSISAALDKLLNDIEECRLDNPDSMFMLSSSIAILIPTVLGSHGDFTSYTKDISNDVWDAYNSHVFEDSDIAKLCFGFVGVCDITLGTNDRLLQIVDTLEKTATGYGGLPSFGAYYGLAIIAQTLASSRKRKAIESQYSSDMEELPGRIIIFLLNELSKCTTGMQFPSSILASSIQNMTITSEEVDTLNQLERASLKVKKSKLRTSKSIFIALGICFPIVSTMDKNLLPPIVSFLESFEWGCGVGFCLGPLLKACRDCNLMDDGEVEKKCDGYSESFEENIGKDADTLHDILSTITALQSKSSSSSIEKIRMVEDARNGRSSSLALAVSSISAIPCLGHGTVSNFTNSPCLKENASDTDVAAVAQFVSEETDDDMAMIMNGLLASLTMSDGSEENSKTDVDNRFSGTKLPEAHLGTGSEILVSSLDAFINEHNDSGLVALLSCFEVIALPDQFSSLVETLTNGQESIKTACVKLLVSQIKGRPRAIFDGRDFVKLALKICKMPPMSIRNMLGHDEAAEIFIGAFGEMLTKFLSHEVEVVIENVFRFCVNHFDRNSALVASFLKSMEGVLHQAEHDKSPRFSPKCLKSIQLFLQQKSFPGIQDAASTDVPPNRITRIVESYADCLAMIPETLLSENEGEIFSTRSDIGFEGEALRIRVTMNLIRNGRCVLFSHSYREIASSMAWLSQQMIACGEEDAFSPAILRVACAVAEASSNETPDKKRDLLVSFLDNLLMVDSSASFVCLEIVAALVHQWCRGSGSDGDLSLLRALGPSIEKWVDLRPGALERAFRLAVRDLPFNLARFARKGNLSGVVFNRLRRIYANWLERGADKNALTALRLSLLRCRDTETGTNAEDIVALVNESFSPT